MTSVEVRRELVNALRLDLVGPGEGLGQAEEVLPQRPSKWYLTGFLVPLDAEEDQRRDEDAAEDLAAGAEPGGTDDDETPEPPPARRGVLPSSMGMSLLVPKAAKHLTVTVRWGDYACQKRDDD